MELQQLGDSWYCSSWVILVVLQQPCLWLTAANAACFRNPYSLDTCYYRFYCNVCLPVVVGLFVVVDKVAIGFSVVETAVAVTAACFMLLTMFVIELV